MLAKLTTLLKSKVALAAIAAVVVGGGGGAVAVAANTGHLSTLGVNFNNDSQNETPEAHDTPEHDHTLGVEGLLTACATTATPPTISVTDHAGKSWTFVITSTTRFNGDESSSEQSGTNSATGSSSDHNATPEATDSAHTGADTGEPQSTRTPGASENDHETGSSVTLATVCAAANINSRHVEVQATPDGSNYDAWKVTLQGSAQSSEHSGDTSGTSGTGGDSSSHTGTDTGSSATQSNQFEGVVTAVSASGFTLKSEFNSYTVVVSATTHYTGASSLSDIHVNDRVAVQGSLSGQMITAAAVVASSSTPSN